MAESADATGADDAATLRVVRGDPTPEELAALVAVIAARAAAAHSSGQRDRPAPVSGWTERSRYVRGRLPHSPDGWRAAALPR
jgi:hypothetical protein